MLLLERKLTNFEKASKKNIKVNNLIGIKSSRISSNNKNNLHIPIRPSTSKFRKLGSKSEKFFRLTDNNFYFEKKKNMLIEEQEKRLEENSLKFRKNEKMKRKVERKIKRNVKYQIENFDKRMNQGVLISNAVKKSNNLLYQDAIKKALEKKRKILEKK